MATETIRVRNINSFVFISYKAVFNSIFGLLLYRIKKNFISDVSNKRKKLVQPFWLYYTVLFECGGNYPA